MSFLLPLALLLGLTAIAPLLAHALRKGRAQAVEFPAAHLVPAREFTSKERNRIEDKLLLLLRILLLFCLALLAASPFVQCSRLSLDRNQGASIAASLIIDDSASMRATTSEGRSRLKSALRSANELLESAQEGDSFSLILAGYPARLLSPPTSDVSSIHKLLDSVRASDRKTDLGAALLLARSQQANLPQTDRPIVLLTDLSIDQATQLDLEGVTLPEGDLREPLSNCALLEATRAGHFVFAELACTDKEAAVGRELELILPSGSLLAPRVEARDGSVKLTVKKEHREDTTLEGHASWEVRLTQATNPSQDQIKEDDSTPVLATTAKLSVALRADKSKAGIKTGSGTVLRAGIEALKKDIRIQGLSVLPERPQELDAFSALIIDDPSGFTPELRDTLTTWATNGGVGLLLLGPGLVKAPLGSDFSPFLEGSPRWSKNPSEGVDPKSTHSLGPLAATWTDLGARYRALFTEEGDIEVKARWDDSQALVIERLLGRGSLLTVSLPASLDQSDFALRPAFLELLDYVTRQGAVRRGAQATPVGESWALPTGAEVTDPNGTVLTPELRQPSSLVSLPANKEGLPGLFIEAAVAGRYRISGPEGDADGASYRYAMRFLSEHVSQPMAGFSGQSASNSEAGLAKAGISREIALLALVLGALELAFRVFRRKSQPAPLPASVSQS